MAFIRKSLPIQNCLIPVLVFAIQFFQSVIIFSVENKVTAQKTRNIVTFFLNQPVGNEPFVHNSEVAQLVLTRHANSYKIKPHRKEQFFFLVEMTFKKSYSTFYTQRTLFTASVRSSFYKKKWKHSGAIVAIVAIVAMKSRSMFQPNQSS